MGVGEEPSAQVRRTVALLWQQPPPPTRGPKPGLTVAQIVDAAVDLADEEGAAAVSMRAVALRLDRSAMSLYTYVPGKAELHDLMLDRVLGEVLHPTPSEEGWRAGLEHTAWATLGMFVRHPWVLEVSWGGATLGPNELAVFEHQLGLLDGLGLADEDVGRIVGAVGSYVRGAAEGVVRSQAGTGEGTLAQRVRERAAAVLLLVGEELADRFPLLARMDVLRSLAQPHPTPPPPTRPAATRASEEGDASWADGFAFGLQRLLDGIELVVTRDAGGAAGGSSPHSTPA